MEEILQKVNASNPLLIRVASGREAAAALLRADPAVSRISIREEDIVVGFLGSREEEAGLLRMLVEAGIPVTGFIREQGDLESIFMQLTDHDKERLVLSSEE